MLSPTPEQRAAIQALARNHGAFDRFIEWIKADREVNREQNERPRCGSEHLAGQAFQSTSLLAELDSALKPLPGESGGETAGPSGA